MKTFFAASMMMLVTATTSAYAGGIFLTACTAEGTPVRLKVEASIKDQPYLRSAFKSVAKTKTVSWFNDQRKHPNSSEFQAAMSHLQNLSAGRLREQNLTRIAASISVAKKVSSKRVYCGQQ